MDKEKNLSQNMKNMIAFIPVFGIIFYFIDNDKTEQFTKNARYAIILLIAYMFYMFFLSWIFWTLTGIIVLAYFTFSIYLWYMAYLWKDVKINPFDKIIDSVFSETK